MRFGILLLLLSILSSPVRAQENEINCEVCLWKTPVGPNTRSLNLHCNDYYSAACLDEKGQLRDKGKTSRDVSSAKTMADLIEKARDKSAVAAGAKSFSDLIEKKLKAKNIKLRKNIKSELKQKFLNESFSFSDSDFLEIFESYSECKKSIEEEEKKIDQVMSDHKEGRDARIKELETNTKALLQKKYVFMKSAYRENIPGFFRKVSQKCISVEGSKPEKPAPEDLALKKICSKKHEIRNDAISAYRAAETKKNLSKALVNKYFPVVAYYDKDTPDSNLYGMKYYLMNNVCEPLKNKLSAQSEEILTDVKEKIARSQPLVEFIIQKIYPQQRLEAVEKLYAIVIREVLKWAEQKGISAEDIEKMRSEYSNVELAWVTSPKSDFYKKDDELGLFVLPDASKEGSGILTLLLKDGINVFYDQNLSFFTEFNASYAPNVTIGHFTRKSTITLMPMILDYLETNPWALVEILAHEAGHKIDANMSAINGFHFESRYRDILACYSSPDSIALKPGQQGETIADYISSEVIASLAEQLPKERKADAIYSAHQFSCLSESWSVYSYDTGDLERTHPAMRLRASGIFGANPKIRKQLGCEGESKFFRSCTMDDNQ